MWNKFLTLGFGCVQEGVLGFQGKIISPVFDWECLHTTIMVTRKSTNGDAVVAMALMSFSFIWDEFAVNILK